MGAPWPSVSLGTVLRRRKDEITLRDDIIYRQVTVRLWNKGIILRGQQPGSEIKTKRQFRVSEGQLLLSRIDVRNGAIGLVPPELHGAVVSNDFWAYEVDVARLAPEYLAMYVSTANFIDSANRTSSGTTKRIRAEEDALMAITVPLPPLPEQQRIGERVEALARRVEEARGLRRKVVQEAKAFERSASRTVFSAYLEYSVVTLESVCSAIVDNLHSNPVYAEGGEMPCIRSQDVGWGKLYLGQAQKTTKEEYMCRTRRGEPSANDIVFVREGGGTGKAAIIEPGQNLSLGQRVMLLRPDKDRVVPRFVLYQLLSPLIYEQQVLPRSKGSASPHLNISALRKFEFILPPLSAQRTIVEYLDTLQAKVDGMLRLQAQTQKEVNALMPSILAKAFAGQL